MHPLRNFSLRGKLTAIIMITSSVAVLVACTVFALYDVTTFWRSLESELGTVAEITGSNMTAALTFGDVKAANEILSSLRIQTHIVEACVYRADGTVLAEFRRGGSKESFTPPAPLPDQTLFVSDYMLVFRQVRLDGEVIGSIYLKSDLGELHARIALFSVILLAVFILSLVISFLLAARLRLLISEPIGQLALTAHEVSVKKDYSLRVAKGNNDEIGFLVDTFNEMLEQIEHREAALQTAHDGLEMRVDERTRELQKEVADRTRAEQELEDRKQFLNYLIVNLPIAIAAIDNDGAVEMCNPAFEALFLYSQQAILGRSLAELVTNSESRSELESHRNSLLRGDGVHVVTRRSRSDGSLVDVEAHSVPLGREGKRTGGLLLYQDITERKLAEEAMRHAKEAAEAASRAKSEFLANMSHELRTPLNSSLILAKILADNKGGNLTEEQVKFAQTISSAGNDLLAIINDILDLSKVEAGKVELGLAPVLVATIVDDLINAFQPVARQKGLSFSAVVEPGSPTEIETDQQRVSQILKNLVSNALKFTEQGAVSLRVSSPTAKTVSFAVHDTGIGISEHQQGIIFEAFRQADGSTHRKYGGTGLGLTISRDLARLLGGDISVQSAAGSGSIFTLTLPLVRADGISVRPTSSGAASTSQPIAPVAAEAHGSFNRLSQGLEDDREQLAPDTPLILVVEDDPAFAGILRDLAREMGFQCVVTHGASDGLAAALLYRPKAILLDLNLPDHSGLGVLDKLKRDPQTRHVPVHIVSVTDYSQEALAMGALGYALKPVRREQLIEALQRLEAKFSQSSRHVLIIEDDERQRDSITKLLESDDVRITAVQNATEALIQLRTTTFDCMVMDLNLPDLSGYELLQQMTEKGDVSFPPIIVYTGRSLTADEEQSLRRFSRSIIIKDARSPERLLDEVTLFLHQVESQLPVERQLMLKAARDREATLDGRRILIVEDDVRNIFALTSLLEPKGAKIEIARNGREAIEVLMHSMGDPARAVDLVLMDVMMPEMDGIIATREIRKRYEWRKLPIIALTAKAMKDDQEKCLAAGANDYIAKPLDVEKLLSLLRVWMPH